MQGRLIGQVADADMDSEGKLAKLLKLDATCWIEPGLVARRQSMSGPGEKRIRLAERVPLPVAIRSSAIDRRRRSKNLRLARAAWRPRIAA